MEKKSQNLTLTIDSDLLKSARRFALERDTSVNQLVREYLEQMTAQDGRRRQAATEIQDIFRRSQYRMGPKTWTREDLHDRSDDRSDR